MIYNENRNIDCPRCHKPMEAVTDPTQSHINCEVCPDHGFFMDAGEFSDFRELTMKKAFDCILAIYRKNQEGGDSA